MIVCLIILAVAAVILSIPIRLELICSNDEIEDKVSVTVRYSFIKFSVYPKKQKSKKGENNKEKLRQDEKTESKEKFSFEKKKTDIENYLKLFNSVKHDIIMLLSYTAKRAVTFDKIGFCSEFGFDDSMQTGIFTGIYNGFIYSVMGVIHHNSHLRDMDITLQPVFGKKCFNYRFSCILHSKTVHIIIIAIKGLFLFMKIKKLSKETIINDRDTNKKERGI